ncbi:hypothetical protein LTR36_011004 [Oleoguttula mirabilis]|uniref:Uncharacterized protein n=1 Tax=Oleoguttula mirabilis TaxID=1507867 RepID=A0AAV9J414_9PEZI|nr:hypothetical protein LTR36_011004 [Oleoguttula mirabilis]
MSLQAIVLTLLSLSVSTIAAPARITARLSPGAATTNDNIQGWLDNIANVNGFLNTAAAGTLTGPALANSASLLLQDIPGAAADEPNRLMALSGLISPADTTAVSASEDLMTIFGGVLGNLTTIVDNSGDAAVISSAVDQINCLRCNFVLPDIDQVFAGAVANNAGATSATTVGPLVCPIPAAGSFVCPAT